MLVLVSASSISLGIFRASHVSDDLSPGDRLAMRDLIDSVTRLSEVGEAEVLTIHRPQREVLRRVPIGDGVERGKPREPKDVLSASRGLCFNRARLMKKALIALGFDVRNVFLLYSDGDGFPRLLAPILQAGAPTHMILEVKLADGWVCVDTNCPWMGTSPEHSLFGQEHNPIVRPNLKARGPYSRNGMFFPPHNRLPDINYREFFYREFFLGNLSAAFGQRPDYAVAIR